MKTACCKLLPALALAAALGPAAAHDTWLSLPEQSDGAVVLSLTTGARYPAAQIAPPAASVARSGCVDGAARPRDLVARGSAGATLSLSTAAGAPPPLACWIVLTEHDIVLDPTLVQVYLKEIKPPPSVVADWDEMRRAGREWKERYTKNARIEIDGGTDDPAALRALRQPVGLPLEIVIAGDRPLRAGERAKFQVLAHGKPVAGLAVELLGERSSFGVWGRTDPAGSLQQVLPFPGKWLLRATLLERDGQQWKSRFVTLAFEARR
jgi:hypothetical protein